MMRQSPIWNTQQVYTDVSNGFRREEIPVFLTNGNYAFFTNTYIIPRIKTFGQDGNINTKWISISVLQILGTCTGIVLLWKAVEIAWCAPPSYELLGGSWKDALFCIMDFYLLAGAGLDNMPFLSHWNLVSILSAAVYFYLFPLCIFTRKPGRK